MLKTHIGLIVLIILGCTSKNSENKNNVIVKDSGASNISRVTIVKPVVFKNIGEVYSDSGYTKWTDKGSFDWLWFQPGKIYFDFNPSCGYWFPAELKQNRIDFYWAKNPDCGFDRGLDTNFKGVKSPVTGLKFGEVYLLNDTTIRIKYLYPDWVRHVNMAEYATIDTLFPTIFTIVHL